MKMDDTSTLEFNSTSDPLDRAAGRLHTIQDRNGNKITLHYDSAGRLERITDTLDREILIAYNSQDLIESVTDFAGRRVRYEYYQAGEAGGNAGDLKSVTSPAVTGTPNGNDYPGGKTTSYTYSTGFEEDSLNGNLLTITDAKGQTFLRNVYGDTTDPNDINFDRVVRQIWGDDGDITDIVYVPQQPAPANNGAVIKAIINDRVGNVREYFYNVAHQLVIDREYTGRADPDQPTTETTNRPVNPLRPDDPPYFETRYTYNSEYKRTRTEHPNGAITLEIYESDINPTAEQRLRGNLRQRVHIPGPLGGDQAQIVESFEYAANLGCGCGGNFVTRHTDGRGNATQHDYDDFGNRIQTIHRDLAIIENWTYNSFGQMATHTLPANDTGHRRVDRYVYYQAGPSRSYLQAEIVDEGGLNLTSVFEYDLVGNVTARIDPRDNETNYVVNELNQVVREIMPAVTTLGGPARYQRDTWYDENNNVIRVDVQNVLDDGSLAANTHFSTIYEYEILNNVTHICQEKGAAQLVAAVLSCDNIPDLSQFIVTEYEYDANRNRTLVRFGEATNGNQPFNMVATLYDERDLVWREVRAPGGSDQSTAQMDYDGNRNLKRRSHGLEAGGHDRLYVVDGFSRMKRMIDPMGNETRYTYDANGNRRIDQIIGQREDVPGATGNVLLTQTTTEFDSMDRPFQVDLAFFDWSGQPIGDGIARTVTTYTPTSQVRTVTNDNNHGTVTSYDTANRRRLVTDAKNNTVEYEYDENSNLRFVIETEKHDLPGRPDELFTTQFLYDELNRQVAVIDNIGNTSRSYLDSRSNRTRTLDALNHEVLYQYDGFSRLGRTIRDMDGSGIGSADADAFAGDPDIGTENIVTEQGWDDSSRLVTQTDDNGNTTTYVYDALNRKVTEDYADCTAKSFTFDPHDNNTSWTDGNQNQVVQMFDDNDRLVRRDVDPGPGVSDDTTFEVYKYDGLSRLTWAQDDDTLVTRQYDSRSRVTRETQDLDDGSVPAWPTAIVTNVYDGVGNMLTLGYPSGRVIATTYDELERKSTIVDTTNPGQPEAIATYWYVGPGRVAQREYGNGTRSEWTYDGIMGVPNPANDFGVKRIVRTNHFRISDGETIDDRTYTWDRIGNKTQRKDIRTDGPWTPQLQHDYTYDNIYRLVRSDTRAPNGPIETIQYTFDGAGNRREVMGGPDAGLYTRDDTLCEPADWQMNQYTSTGHEFWQHDYNGSVVQTEFSHTYDFRNQTVAYRADNAYWYDCLGRRAMRGAAATPIREMFSRWTVIERTRDGTASSQVFGLYVDELLEVRSGGVRNYYVTDDLFDVSVVMSINDAIERYEYSDYGSPQFFDPDGTVLPESAVDNATLYKGLVFDSESHSYFNRLRWVDVGAGRFLSRDQLGLFGDPSALGNPYTYLSNNPFSSLDPWGLAPVPPSYLTPLPTLPTIPLGDPRRIPGYDPRIPHPTPTPGWRPGEDVSGGLGDPDDPVTIIQGVKGIADLGGAVIRKKTKDIAEGLGGEIGDRLPDGQGGRQGSPTACPSPTATPSPPTPTPTSQGDYPAFPRIGGPRGKGP